MTHQAHYYFQTPKPIFSRVNRSSLRNYQSQTPWPQGAESTGGCQDDETEEFGKVYRDDDREREQWRRTETRREDGEATAAATEEEIEEAATVGEGGRAEDLDALADAENANETSGRNKVADNDHGRGLVDDGEDGEATAAATEEEIEEAATIGEGGRAEDVDALADAENANETSGGTKWRTTIMEEDLWTTAKTAIVKMR